MISNGWFINDDRAVYAIINGSPIEVDAKGTPLEKLEPGSYTDAQAQAALAKLEEDAGGSKD